MYLVLLGLAFVGLKFFDIAPVAHWPWWGVLLPFGGAALWWAIADRTGYYQRREQRNMDAKRDARRARSLEALGMGKRRK